MKNLIFNILKLSLVVGIIYYLVSSERLNFEKLRLLLQSPAILLGTSLTLALLVVPLTAFRWWLLLRAIGLKVQIKNATLLTWIGNFFNVTLPGAVSGDLVKGFYIIRQQEEGSEKTKVFTSLIIDRFVGLFGLIVMAFVAMMLHINALIMQDNLLPLVWMISGLFIGTIFFYIIVLFPFTAEKDPFLRLFRKIPGGTFLSKIYTAFKIYEKHKKTLIYTLGISVVIQTTVAFLFYQMSSLIGIKEMSLASQLFIMPIGLITVAVPIAPGGIGVGHVAFDRLYHLFGVVGGADVFNLFVIVQLAIYLLGGIPYVLYKQQWVVKESEKSTPI